MKLKVVSKKDGNMQLQNILNLTLECFGLYDFLLLFVLKQKSTVETMKIRYKKLRSVDKAYETIVNRHLVQ